MRTAVSTLAELVAPLTEDAFTGLLRERKLTFLRAADAGRREPMLNWETLLGMIERGDYPRGFGEFRLARESVNIPRDCWLTRSKVDNSSRIDTSKVEEYMASGYSLIVTPVEPYVPALAALCDDITSRVSEQIKVGVIVTVGAGGAFRLHFDPEDLIILQVEGTKRWQIFGPPVSNPVIGMPKVPPPPETAPIFDEVLQPGDLLFLPAGNWHHCQNGPGRSIHLGFFFIPPTSWHAVQALASQLVSEEMFRTPLTRLEGASELAALESDIKSHLVEKIGRLKLDDFLSEWKKRKRNGEHKPAKTSEPSLSDFLAHWNKKA